MFAMQHNVIALFFYGSSFYKCCLLLLKVGAPHGFVDLSKVQSVRTSGAKGFSFEIIVSSKTHVFVSSLFIV
jgi:hypothetical protein